MFYCSTRGNDKTEASSAILAGIAGDGGLFTPTEIPRLPRENVSVSDGYADIAAKILSAFLTDYDGGVILESARKAYGENFGGHPAPVTKLGEGLFSLELWHGPTSAFKDIALQLMPYLFREAKRINGSGETSLILVATSGDTGKAALEGYKDIDGVKIAVFYPSRGVSEIQRLQMVTQTGGNVFAAAVDGNFDDTQRAVKTLMTDSSFISEMNKKHIRFGSANSINWGRLAPQIVYYFTSYDYLVKNKEISYGEKVNFAVPSGNFGNILAGFYAKEMGLPVGKLICASNRNNVLTDFINSGVYCAKREFFTTISPSMDILVSSNVERLLWYLTGQDSRRVDGLFRLFSESGQFSLSPSEFKGLREDFDAYYCDDDTTKARIKKVYDDFSYLIDPHTAVAFEAVSRYRGETKDDNTPTVVISTASPFKFAGDVLDALGHRNAKGFEAIRLLSELTGIEAPRGLTEISELPVRFENLFSPGDERKALMEFIG